MEQSMRTGNLLGCELISTKSTDTRLYTSSADTNKDHCKHWSNPITSTSLSTLSLCIITLIITVQVNSTVYQISSHRTNSKSTGDMLKYTTINEQGSNSYWINKEANMTCQLGGGNAVRDMTMLPTA